jgi:hypothetical protein
MDIRPRTDELIDEVVDSQTMLHLEKMCGGVWHLKLSKGNQWCLFNFYRGQMILIDRGTA